MYFVCFQRVVKAQEEVYQFMEREQKVFVLSRLLYGLVQIRNTSARRGKAGVKLKELSKKHKSREWEYELPAPKRHRILQGQTQFNNTKDINAFAVLQKKNMYISATEMRLSAKLSTDVAWWGPGSLGNSQAQQRVPSDPSSMGSWLLLMAMPSAPSWWLCTAPSQRHQQPLAAPGLAVSTTGNRPGALTESVIPSASHQTQAAVPVLSTAS